MVKRKGRPKESDLKYALFRTTGKTREKVLHSKHLTKANAIKAKMRAEKETPFRKPFTIRKLKD